MHSYVSTNTLIIKNSFTALKITCNPPIHPTPPALPTTNPLKPQSSFNCLHIFAFSRISDIWNHTVCRLFRGLPGGSEVKASASNAGDPGSIPGLGRSPGEGHGNPLQYSCLENPMDRGAW